MKKFISIFALLLCVCITSCDDENNATEELSIIARESTITAAEGEVTVTLSTEVDKAISDKEWCKATLDGNLLHLTLDANTGLEGRTAKIEIIKGQKNLPYYVTQPGNLIPVAETEEITFNAHGGSREISVNSSMPFTATSTDSWLTVQVNENKLTLSTSTNYTREVLSTTVKLISGSLESTLTVTQTGIELTPEKSSVVMYYSGDEQTIQVNSTLPFTAVAEDDSWLTVTNDDNSLTIIASDNSGHPARSTQITLTSGELTATIDVTQRPIIYSDYLGNWTLSDDNGLVYNLNITQDQAETSYKVTGWGKSVVATNSQYALTAYFHKETGMIFITEQEGIGIYTDEGKDYEVVFYARVEIGGKLYYVGDGTIVYIGLLLRNGDVQWINGNWSLEQQELDLAGGHYFIFDSEEESLLNFNVDIPFMSNPRMTKATTTKAAAHFATRSIITPDNRQHTTIATNGKQLEIKNNKGQKANYDEVLRSMVPAFLKRP